MKVYVEFENKYLLLNDDKDYSNIDKDVLKTEIINEAMNLLENKKLNMEIAKQRKGGYKVKKMGVYSKVGRRIYW